MKILRLFFISLMFPALAPAQEIIPLPNKNDSGLSWEGEAHQFYFNDWKTEVITNVSSAHLEVFTPDPAIANEAHDLVRPAPVMEALSHIAQRLLADRHIDMLHPHATGTAHHDPAELSAVAPHLHNQPDGYACKGALGHGLGAAGLVSLVIACLCAKTRRRQLHRLSGNAQKPSDVAGRSATISDHGDCRNQANRTDESRPAIGRAAHLILGRKAKPFETREFRGLDLIKRMVAAQQQHVQFIRGADHDL